MAKCFFGGEVLITVGLGSFKNVYKRNVYIHKRLDIKYGLYAAFATRFFKKNK